MFLKPSESRGKRIGIDVRAMWKIGPVVLGSSSQSWIVALRSEESGVLNNLPVSPSASFHCLNFLSHGIASLAMSVWWIWMGFKS